MVSIDRVTLAKTGVEASPAATLTASTSVDEDLNIDECPPQLSKLDAKTGEYVINKFVDER